MPKRGSSRRRALSEEERAERRDAERALMAQSIEQLQSSEGWKRWLSLRRRLRSYSLHNQLLILEQCPGATRVMGFRSWLELGYAVRKGERGIRILAPCPPSKKRLREWREKGADPEAKPPTFFCMVSVFDRSQVDPLPDFPGGPVELESPFVPITGEGLAGLLGPLRGLAASIGYAFEVRVIEGAAKGRCEREERRITIEEVGAEFSPNAQVAVGIHELAHALIVCERVEGDPRLACAEEEVVVECVACTVCGSLGLDTFGSSVPYMTSWAKGGEIERYAELIDRIAKRLEDALLEVEDGGQGEGAAAGSAPLVMAA